MCKSKWKITMEALNLNYHLYNRPLIFQFVLRERGFLSSGLAWASLKFWGNVLVSIEMLIMSVMGVINVLFFNTLVGMGSRSHDFDDELKISVLISSSDALLKTSFLDLISGLCTGGVFCTSSGNLERIVSILSTKYLEKWSQSDFTDVNSGRAGGGILCRMFFIKFHRRRGLSEFSEITSAKYFD